MNLGISWNFGFPLPWAKQAKDAGSTDVESNRDGITKGIAEGFTLTQQSLAQRLFVHSPLYARHLSVLNARISSGDSEEDDDDDVRERVGRETALGDCDLFVEIRKPVKTVKSNADSTPSTNNNINCPVPRGVHGVASRNKQQAEYSERVSLTEEIGYTLVCPKKEFRNEQDDKEEENEGDKEGRHIRSRSLRGVEIASKSPNMSIAHRDLSNESLNMVSEQQDVLTYRIPPNDSKAKAVKDQPNSKTGSEEWIEQRQGVAEELNSYIGESLVAYTSANSNNRKYSLSREELAYLEPFELGSTVHPHRKRHELRYWLKLGSRHSSESFVANPIIAPHKYQYPQTCVDIYHEESANIEICKISRRSRIKRRFGRVSSAKMRKLSKSA